MDRCPKCATPVADATARACTQCGLATAHMARFAAAQDADMPASLRTAWDAASADWTNGKRHDELLEVVAFHGSYAWAAGRYRRYALEHADDATGAIARERLERLRRAGEAQLFAQATPRRAGKPPLYWVAVAILVAAIIGAVLAGYYALSHDAPPPEPPPAMRTHAQVR